MLTRRLALDPIDASHIAQMISGDVTALAASLRVQFPTPFEAPPLLAEDLPYFYQHALEQTPGTHWGVWLISLRDTSAIIGAAGFTGAPDADGVVYVGYSVYPKYEGNGYATEAIDALIDWAIECENVRIIRATIPPWNAASVRVAEKIGMSHIAMAHDEEVGEVMVFEMSFADGAGQRSVQRSAGGSLEE